MSQSVPTSTTPSSSALHAPSAAVLLEVALRDIFGAMGTWGALGIEARDVAFRTTVSFAPACEDMRTGTGGGGIAGLRTVGCLRASSLEPTLLTFAAAGTSAWFSEPADDDDVRVRDTAYI